jgi:type I restriction enzyme S subunit
MSTPAQPKPPEGYIHTVVGFIPQDWSVSTVGAEFAIQLGKMLDAAKNVGIPKPYIGNRAVQWGKVDLEDIAMVPMSLSDLDRFRLQRGDLLVCEGGEVGRAAIWNDQIPECYYQKALHRLRATQGYDAFLMMSLLQLWASSGHLSNYVTQTSIAHLPKDKFELVPLPVPTPAEQLAIAETLSDMDGLIVALEKLVAKKRAIRQAAMQQLLTGKTRLPEFSDKWVMTSLGDVAEVKTGPFGSALHERDYVRAGTPIITVEHLGERGVVYANLPMVSDADRDRLKMYSLATGDIVFSRVGAIDRNALIQATEDGWLFSGRLLRVRPDRAHVFSPYLSHHFHSEQFKLRVRGVAVGQTMASLNTRILQGVEVVLPGLSEQKAIATILSDIDAEIEALERRWNKTKQIKQGMLQQLLTGRSRLVKPQVSVTLVDTTSKGDKPHSWAFNEAIVIAMLAKTFGSEQFPLGRKRYTKLSYLLHRHAEKQAEGYLKKAAGPYNPKTKYGGPERIAVETGYVREHKSGPYSGFVAADTLQAEGYFEKWYGSECLQWLDQFRRKRNDDLELLTTVDMAAEELRAAGKNVDVAGVKDFIRSHPEWEAKLDRPVFSGASIAKAIETSQKLFGP